MRGFASGMRWGATPSPALEPRGRRADVIELRRILSLFGPNVWGPYPIVEVWIAAAGPEDERANCLNVPMFRERVRALLPGLDDPGATLGEIVGRVAAHLHAIAWRPAGPTLVGAPADPGVERIAVPCAEESLGRESVRSARELCEA